MVKQPNLPSNARLLDAKERLESAKQTLKNEGMFSVYSSGYINKEGKAVPQVKAYGTWTMKRAMEYITSNEQAKVATKKLRRIKDHDENSKFKVLNFHAATFSGLFVYRNAKGHRKHSGKIVLDYDHLTKTFPGEDIIDIIEKLKRMFIEDNLICTIMIFVSPNGDGLKAVIYVGDMQGLSHKDCFDAISEYVRQRYGIETDKSGSNVDRLCFLPYDPECYLRPEDAELFSPKINLRAWLEESKVRHRISISSMSSCPYQGKGDDVFSLVERWVSRDTAYIEGSYNRYVMKCGYLLCNFGVPEPEAEEWAVARFNDYEGRQVRSIIQSCYRNGEFGKYTFR